LADPKDGLDDQSLDCEAMMRLAPVHLPLYGYKQLLFANIV